MIRTPRDLRLPIRSARCSPARSGRFLVTAALVLTAACGGRATPAPTGPAPTGTVVATQTSVTTSAPPPATSTVPTAVTTTAPGPLPDLEGWAGSAAARSLAVTLRKVVLDQTGCDTPDDLISLANQVLVAPAEVRDLLLTAGADLQRSADLCSADASGWQQALEAALGHLEAVTSILNTGAPVTPPAPAPPLTAAPETPEDFPSTDSLIGTARHAVSTFGALHHQLVGGGDDAGPAAHWVSWNHEGRHGDLANAVAGGGFDIVVVGSSLVVSGFDPVQLAADDGRRVFNAGLPRITAEELPIWLDTVVRLAGPDLVVYGTETRDVRILGDDPESCGADIGDWVWSAELQANAFAAVPVYEGLSWEHLMFGQPVRFEASRDYRSSTNEFGGKVLWTAETDAQIQVSLDRSGWEGPYPLCRPRIEAVAANVSKLRSLGIDVVVVFMPVSDLRAGQFEGGRREVAGVVSLIETAVREAGATAILDFTDLLPPSGFRDPIHANEDGRRAITDELAARLAALGI